MRGIKQDWYVLHGKSLANPWIFSLRLLRTSRYPSWWVGLCLSSRKDAWFLVHVSKCRCNYRSSSALWYEEIHKTFPDAKVILSVRDSEEVWVKSWVQHNDLYLHLGFLQHIIFWYIAPYIVGGFDAILAREIDMAAYGSLCSESTLLFKKKYREHNERVQAIIPKEKLLMYNVKQGWKPLCEFLGCEIPEREFPRENVGDARAKKGIKTKLQFGTMKLFVIFAALGFLASAVHLMWYCNESFVKDVIHRG